MERKNKAATNDVDVMRTVATCNRFWSSVLLQGESHDIRFHGNYEARTRNALQMGPISEISPLFREKSATETQLAALLGSSFMFCCSVWNIFVSTVTTSHVRVFGSTAIVIATQKKETALDEEEEEPPDLPTTCVTLHHNHREKRNTCSS